MLTLRKDATSTQLLDYNSEGKKNYRSGLYSPHLRPSSNFSGLAKANSFFFFFFLRMLNLNISLTHFLLSFLKLESISHSNLDLKLNVFRIVFFVKYFGQSCGLDVQ